jgi:hypothetical protein
MGACTDDSEPNPSLTNDLVLGDHAACPLQVTSNSSIQYMVHEGQPLLPDLIRAVAPSEGATADTAKNRVQKLSTTIVPFSSVVDEQSVGASATSHVAEDSHLRGHCQDPGVLPPRMAETCSPAQVSTVPPQVSTVLPQVSTVPPQVSTVPPQVSTVPPQVSTVPPQVSIPLQAEAAGAADCNNSKATTLPASQAVQATEQHLSSAAAAAAPSTVTFSQSHAVGLHLTKLCWHFLVCNSISYYLPFQ